MQGPIYRVPCNENSKPESKSPFFFPLHQGQCGWALPAWAFGLVWFNPKLGRLGKERRWPHGKGRVWCGAQGRTQNNQGRFLQHFHSISGVSMKDALASRWRSRQLLGGKGAKTLAKILLSPGSPIVVCGGRRRRHLTISCSQLD